MYKKCVKLLLSKDPFLGDRLDNELEDEMEDALLSPYILPFNNSLVVTNGFRELIKHMPGI